MNAILSDAAIDDVDRSLEIVALVRTSEAAIARDYRVGVAFGQEADERRLNAFTFGLIDALARCIGNYELTLKLLTYIHVALKHGAGKTARKVFSEYLGLANEPKLARYVAGGRLHIVRVLVGNAPQAGRFAELLAEELEEGQ